MGSDLDHCAIDSWPNVARPWSSSTRSESPQRQLMVATRPRTFRPAQTTLCPACQRLAPCKRRQRSAVHLSAGYTGRPLLRAGPWPRRQFGQRRSTAVEVEPWMSTFQARVLPAAGRPKRARSPPRAPSCPRVFVNWSRKLQCSATMRTASRRSPHVQRGGVACHRIPEHPLVGVHLVAAGLVGRDHLGHGLTPSWSKGRPRSRRGDRHVRMDSESP